MMQKKSITNPLFSNYKFSIMKKFPITSLGIALIALPTVAQTSSGTGSTAIGDSTIASGLASTAIGGLTKASGDYATAIGYKAEARGLSSTAMGYKTKAYGEHSTAMGSQTAASETLPLPQWDFKQQPLAMPLLLWELGQ